MTARWMTRLPRQACLTTGCRVATFIVTIWLAVLPIPWAQAGQGPPTLSSFTPICGGIGTSVTITGTDFIGASSVRFNGVAATFTVESSAQITATVPSGASTGEISVTTPGGTATSSASFTFISTPGLSRWRIALVSAAALATIGGLVVRKIHKLRPPTGRISVRLRRGEPEVLVVAEPNGSPRHAVRLMPRPDPGVQQVRERSPR